MGDISLLLALPLVLPLLAGGLMLSLRRIPESWRHGMNIATCGLMVIVAGVILTEVAVRGVIVLNVGGGRLRSASCWWRICWRG